MNHSQKALSLALVPLLLGKLSAEVPTLAGLPRYQTPTPEMASRIWHITQNLGPTGARGWLYGAEGHSRDSREILVKSIEAGSPADGVLKPYDLIIGASVPPDLPSTSWQSDPEVKPFDSDARMSLARAITWAESEKGGGKLRLLCVRDGKTGELVVEIPVMGDYAASAPFDCAKSTKIVDQAGRFLSQSMPADGYSTGVGRPLDAMFMLATGEAAYLDHVRRSACRMSVNHTISDAGHETWRWGYTNLFLCEYYLATGDIRVLPSIQEYCRVLAEGQCNPGTWGHRGVPDFIPPGYGSLNSSGVVCFLSLVLGEQCGVKVDHRALANSISFYGSYAGRGGIPYGDHPPTYDASSNGKNGMAAVAFNVLRARSASQWFGRMACSSNLRAFEGGHTGNFFNQTWTPLGASLTGRENYSAFWSRLNSYRDLARRWDGSFMTQPFPHKREGDLGTGSYVSKGPIWSTGGFALSYLADTKALAVLGRTDSVFSAYAPQELEASVALYQNREFEACLKLASGLLSSDDQRVRNLAVQLMTMSRRNLASIESTLAEMKKCLELGDLYQLKCQLQAVESVLAADDPRLEAFHDAINDPANANALEEGAQFHSVVKAISFEGLKGFQRVSATGSVGHRRARMIMNNLQQRGKSAYRTLATAHLDQLPGAFPVATVDMLTDATGGPAEWQLMPEGEDVDATWYQRGSGDADWAKVNLPSKSVVGHRCLRTSFDGAEIDKIRALHLEYVTPGETKVYLNGQLIVHLDPEGGKMYEDRATIPLKSSALQLLKRGSNELAVECHHPKGTADFILNLKAVEK